MPVVLKANQVLKQSEAVFGQFGEKWKENALFNVRLPRRNAHELQNSGVGKFIVCAAMGASLEEHLDTLIKYRDRFDLITNDKCFGPLLKRGLKADKVMLCDANVPFRHLEDFVGETEGVELISTVYGNPEWTSKWKGPRFFYINRDAINTERFFRPIFGEETRSIPAGSNVSNAMLVFLTGSDNAQNINFSGYERFILVGYDYSWRKTGNYYAWNNPIPKRNYMNHRTMLDVNGDLVFTSENLLFSAQWLYSYVTTFNLPVVNCSGRGLLGISTESLESTLRKINPDRSVRNRVKELFDAANAANSAAIQTRSIFEKSREGLYNERG